MQKLNHTYQTLLLISLFMIVSIAGFNQQAVSAANELVTQNVEQQTVENENYFKLDGDWTFFHEQLLSPNELSVGHLDDKGETVKIPSSFEKTVDEVNSFGTYVRTTILHEDMVGKDLAIHVPYQYSAYKLYVNEKLIASNGTVGINKRSHEAEMAPRIGYFTPDTSEIQIIMQVSSFNHIRGGFENSLFLGESSVVDQKADSQMITSTFINGFIFIIGIFMILFALYRRQESLFLMFGLFVIFVSIRSFFTVPFHYTILFPNISWVWGTRLEYMLTISASMLYVMLMWKWHEREFSKNIMYFLVGVHSIVLIATLFTQPVFFQTLFFNVFYLAIPTFIYFIYVVIKSVRNNNMSEFHNS